VPLSAALRYYSQHPLTPATDVSQPAVTGADRPIEGECRD
jgi:hypothetical protein